MSTITPIHPPSQAMIEAHLNLLRLPGVRSNPARVAQIRELLRSWGVDPDTGYSAPSGWPA